MAYVFGSGSGLPSAKKDMEQARGRWGHRNQDTIQCTFTSELAAAPPQFPNPGIATHTIIVVPRASP